MVFIVSYLYDVIAGNDSDDDCYRWYCMESSVCIVIIVVLKLLLVTLSLLTLLRS